ncbi:MAG: response regulator transcription factor [Alsobacter sp.]
MRVLIVEDDRQIAAEVAHALEGAGYVAEVSHDGEDAWFRAETQAFDAIVLDLGLPQLDGLSVLKRLRAADVSTPVLILTARGSWMERVDGIDAGADDYLTKPFHTEELLARLGAVLRRLAGRDTPVLKAGQITIDTRRMRVVVDGKPVPLSPLEYRLLRYLVHNSNRMVSKAELAEHVYSDDTEPDSNTLEVVVGRIRRKMGADLVRTQRGFGYIVEG